MSANEKSAPRFLAFCLVIAGVALIPTQHAEQREPDASTPPTISTSRWVSGWSMRRREFGGDMRLLAVGREGSSVVGRLTLRAGLQPPSRKPPKRDDRAEERSLRA